MQPAKQNSSAIRRSTGNRNPLTQPGQEAPHRAFDALQNQQQNGANQHHGSGQIESQAATTEPGGRNAAVDREKPPNSVFHRFQTGRQRYPIWLIAGSIDVIDDESTNSAHSCNIASRYRSFKRYVAHHRTLGKMTSIGKCAPWLSTILRNHGLARSTFAQMKARPAVRHQRKSHAQAKPKQ